MLGVETCCLVGFSLDGCRSRPDTASVGLCGIAVDKPERTLEGMAPAEQLTRRKSLGEGRWKGNKKGRRKKKEIK